VAKAFFENEDIDAGLDLAIFYKNLAIKNKDNALHKLFFTPTVSINRILYFPRNIS
jgi:hypothetical protein